jgi:hypothetical protein
LLDHLLRMSSGEPPLNKPSDDLFKKALLYASRIRDENKKEFDTELQRW